MTEGALRVQPVFGRCRLRRAKVAGRGAGRGLDLESDPLPPIGPRLRASGARFDDAGYRPGDGFRFGALARPASEHPHHDEA